MTTRANKGNLEERDDDSIVVELLSDILAELKILNTYMSEGFDEEITIEDLEDD